MSRRIVNKTFALFLSLFLLSALEKPKISFPELKMWKNSPRIEFEQNKVAILKKDAQIKNAFTIVTGLIDEAQIVFNGGESITVLGDSKVQIPEVSPDTGRVPELFIKDGIVRFQSSPSAVAKPIHIRSLFFDIILPSGADVFFNVDMKKAQAQYQVVKGELLAQFLDFEKKQILKAGEAITFKGELEGVSIKYDYLLNSRKAPHGVLGEIQSFDFGKYIEKEKAEEKIKQEKIQQNKKAQIEKRKKLKAYEDSFLCHKPYGQKDQCFWLKKDMKCFRYRCNVSGEWGDETERPFTEVCQNAVSAVCDY